MIISSIVAADENNAIGNENQLLCYLPADLKYFKSTTTGHHIIMGRKTFESVGKPLPNRVNIVISSNPNLKLEGCTVKTSLADAIAFAEQHGETELFITGGGNVYKQSMAITDRVYLTRIHHQFKADTYYPELLPTEWKLSSAIEIKKDEKNLYDFSFLVYDRIK